MDNEFPPNSHSRKDVRPERRSEKDVAEKKEVVQVTKGKVRLRKKPLWKKFVEAFRPEDNRGFAEYTLLEVLVPSIKDAIADAGTSAIENALGTGPSRRYRRGGGGSGYTSYNRMSSRSRGSRRDRDDDDRPRRRERRSSSDVPEAILDSRVEAEEVLDTMIELLSNYDVVTKRDLLGMLGEPHSFTDEDWGWTDLRGARIHRIGQHGYLLDLPRPEALD